MSMANVHAIHIIRDIVKENAKKKQIEEMKTCEGCGTSIRFMYTYYGKPFSLDEAVAQWVQGFAVPYLFFSGLWYGRTV